MTWTRPATALVTSLVLLAAAGCGGQDDQDGADPGAVRTAASGATYDDADVAFATDMIPHHAQALSMVDLTTGRDLSPDLAELTTAIRDAQAPEIEQMTDWLTDWGQPVPATMRDHEHAPHDDGHGSSSSDSDADSDAQPEMDMGDMPGMMSAEDMDALAAAQGADFEQQWLTMMVEHHEGAVEMARTEIADGENADAVALARSIVSSQTDEIDTMQAMLADRSG